MNQASEQAKRDREVRDAKASQQAMQSMQAAAARIAASSAIRLSDNAPFIQDLRLMGVRI